MISILYTISMVLFYCLLGVLALALWMLNMPYRIRFFGSCDDSHYQVRGYVGWPLRLLGGRLEASNGAQGMQKITLYLFGIPFGSWPLGSLVEKSKGKRKKKKKTSEKKKSKTSESRYWMRMPHKRDALRQVPRLLSMHGNMEGRIGFDDPYTTSKLAVALQMIQIALPSFGQQVRFDYVEPVCVGTVRLSMTLWLPRILFKIVMFILSREGWAMVRYYRARPKPAEST